MRLNFHPRYKTTVGFYYNELLLSLFYQHICTCVALIVSVLIAFQVMPSQSRTLKSNLASVLLETRICCKGLNELIMITLKIHPKVKTAHINPLS